MVSVVVREVEERLGSVMRGFDAAVIGAEDAAGLMASFTRIKRMAEAGEALCARRAAATSIVRRRGDASGSTWAGRRLGVSPGQAGGLLEMAGQLEQLPATRAALLAGEISTDQAREVARTATVLPGAEADLLRVAPRESLGELKRRGRRLRAAGPGSEDRFARIRERRYLRTWTDDEGAGRGAWSLPPEDQAVLLAALAPLREQIFRDARTAGRREPAEAYDADALSALARDAMAVADSDGADGDSRPEAPPDPSHEGDQRGARDDRARRGGAHDGSADGGSAGGESRARGRRWDGRTGRAGRATKIIVRVDRDALLRGHPVGGEVCEVTGVGPVPVAAVQRWIEEDAFLAAVVTDGVDIRSVVHLGRQATARQRTALQWLAPECCVVGCNAQARLEIDHEQDWARTRHTTLDELDHLCAHHHRLKTRHDHRLEPGTGKRRLLSPGEAVAAPRATDPGTGRTVAFHRARPPTITLRCASRPQAGREPGASRPARTDPNPIGRRTRIASSSSHHTTTTGRATPRASQPAGARPRASPAARPGRGAGVRPAASRRR